MDALPRAPKRQRPSEQQPPPPQQQQQQQQQPPISSLLPSIAFHHEDGEDAEDDDDDDNADPSGGLASSAIPGGPGAGGAGDAAAGGGGGKKVDKRTGRRKIKIEFIQDKSRRHITFSKRKAGIMKKAYELSTLTGTQVLLLVVSETGLVYTFTTAKLQPLVTQPEGKNLIQACLNAPGPNTFPSGPSSGPGPGAGGSGNAGSSGAAGGGAGGGGGGGGGGMPGGGGGPNSPIATRERDHRERDAARDRDARDAATGVRTNAVGGLAIGAGGDLSPPSAMARRPSLSHASLPGGQPIPGPPPPRGGIYPPGRQDMELDRSDSETSNSVSPPPSSMTGSHLSQQQQQQQPSQVQQQQQAGHRYTGHTIHYHPYAPGAGAPGTAAGMAGGPAGSGSRLPPGRRQSVGGAAAAGGPTSPGLGASGLPALLSDGRGPSGTGGRVPTISTSSAQRRMSQHQHPGSPPMSPLRGLDMQSPTLPHTGAPASAGSGPGPGGGGGGGGQQSPTMTGHYTVHPQLHHHHQLHQQQQQQQQHNPMLLGNYPLGGGGPMPGAGGGVGPMVGVGAGGPGSYAAQWGSGVGGAAAGAGGPGGGGGPGRR